MKKLKVAVIGYGRSGRDIHTHLMKQSPTSLRSWPTLTPTNSAGR